MLFGFAIAIEKIIQELTMNPKDEKQELEDIKRQLNEIEAGISAAE